jgi:hypothetical protein
MRVLPLLLAFLASCAPPAVETSPEARAQGGESERTRDFAALLRTRPASGEARCLLVDAQERLELGVSLVSAVNPRPDPPADLLRRIAREEDGLTLFTLYGHFGDEGIPLTSITRHAPPLGPLIGVYLTRSGAHVAAPRRETEGPFGLDELEDALTRAGISASHLVAVVPSADTPVEAVASVLALIDDRGAEATLAIPLPEGTRLRSAAPEPSRAGMCGELAAAPVPEGDLAMSAVRTALADLAADVRACRARASSYEAARGGALGLFLRVGTHGRVIEACMDEDTVGDAALRACVLEHAHGLVFDAPVPAGTVDLRVPLRIERDASDRARGVCRSR